MYHIIQHSILLGSSQCHPTAVRNSVTNGRPIFLDLKQNGRSIPPTPLSRVMPHRQLHRPAAIPPIPISNLTEQTDNHIHHRTHPQTIDGKDPL